MADASWVLPTAGGSVLRLHVRPGASRPGLDGLHGGALALRVGARPVGGAANREVLRVLAAALGVALSSLEVAAGSRGREKRVRVRGLDPSRVREKLDPLIEFDRAETRD